VTTSVGLEGIDAQSGSHLLVADHPEQFAQAVTELLRDASLQRRLAEAGRRLVEERYDKGVVLGKMAEMYRQIEERRRKKRLPTVKQLSNAQPDKP
jgi:glycosyltransferase involved in cell wall biosynthesis